MSGIQWAAPAKDGFGAQVWRGTRDGVALPVVITSLGAEGICVRKVATDGGRGEVVSLGFRSVEAAKDHVGRMPHG